MRYIIKKYFIWFLVPQVPSRVKELTTHMRRNLYYLHQHTGVRFFSYPQCTIKANKSDLTVNFKKKSWKHKIDCNMIGFFFLLLSTHK